MALPAAWTESTLIAAVEDELESVSADLGLGSLGVVATAVGRDVPALLGVADVADVDYADTATVVKVHAAAVWKGWQKARDVAAVRFDLKAGSSDLKQSQMWEHLTAKLAEAEAAYYAAAAASASDGSSGFYFALATGCRGR